MCFLGTFKSLLLQQHFSLSGCITRKEQIWRVFFHTISSLDFQFCLSATLSYGCQGDVNRKKIITMLYGEGFLIPNLFLLLQSHTVLSSFSGCMNSLCHSILEEIINITTFLPQSGPTFKYCLRLSSCSERKQGTC